LADTEAQEVAKDIRLEEVENQWEVAAQYGVLNLNIFKPIDWREIEHYSLSVLHIYT
jgi:hypothetical protein